MADERRRTGAARKGGGILREGRPQRRLAEWLPASTPSGSRRLQLPGLHDMRGAETAEGDEVLPCLSRLAQLAKHIGQRIMRRAEVRVEGQRLLEGLLGLLPLPLPLIDEADGIVGTGNPRVQ